MSLIPTTAKKIEVDGATVDFYLFENEGISTYYFDSSICSPPDPMVNALFGLQLIDEAHKKLIMINHMLPNALFNKVSNNYNYDIKSQGDLFLIEFVLKT